MTPRIDLGELSGKITLDGEITGELASPQYAWTLSVQELNSHKLTIGDLRASGSGDLDALKISNLQVRGEMGSVDGEARSDLMEIKLKHNFKRSDFKSETFWPYWMSSGG